MSRRKIVLGLCVLYLVGCFAVYFGVDSYIENKKDRFRDLAYSTFDSFFEEKPMYIDIFPLNLQYKETDSIPFPDCVIFDKAYSLHYSDPARTYISSEIENCSPWKLIIMRRSNEKYGVIEHFSVAPTRISYTIDRNYTPSLQQVLDETIKYIINDSNSDVSRFYEQGSIDKLFSRMELTDNKYFYISEDSDSDLDTIPSAVGVGWIPTELYAVNFSKLTLPTFSIKYVGDDYVNKDKNHLRIGLLIVLSVIMGIVALYLYIIKSK